MRILLQTYAFWPAWGGVQKFARQLHNFLRKTRWRSRIATSNFIVIDSNEKYIAWPWTDTLGTQLLRFNFDSAGTIFTGNFLNAVYFKLAYCRYFLYLFFFRPKIVHLIYINIDAVFALRAKKRFHFKLLTSCRGSDILRLPDKSTSYRKFVLEVLRASDAITAVSNEIAVKIKEIAGEEISVCVIPNAVEHRDSPTASRVKTFVFAGHMNENKNPEVVIRAFANFQKLHPDYSLTMIGRGCLLQSMRTLAADYALDGAVRFTGGVPSEEASGLIESAVALIIASESEGCPNVVLEAMSAGAVVIGANQSGIKEIIRDGENGLLFAFNDAHQLSKCMQRVVESEELRARLVSNARSTIRSNHDPAGVLQRYLAIYDQLAE